MLLAEEPMHGYRIIQEIAERSDGQWRPSAGSVYPTISQLEDEGLIRLTQGETPRVAQLTDAGRAYAEAHAAELRAVWTDATESWPDAMHALRKEVHAARAALFEVMHTANEQQLAQATKILAEARRSLLKITAEEDTDD